MSYRDMVAVVDDTEKIEMWYCRFGQTSDKRMKMLVTNVMISELKSVEHNTCESYILRKQK